MKLKKEQKHILLKIDKEIAMLLFSATFRDGEKREFSLEGKKVVETREKVHNFDSAMEARQWWLDRKSALHRRGCNILHAGASPVTEKKEIKEVPPRKGTVRVFGKEMKLDNNKGGK